VSQLQVPATTAGYGQLLAWVRMAAGDRQAVWAVEGTRHYGLGLARYLTSQDQQVSEIDCSRHIGKRRAGKSDPIDAVRAARELLARPWPAQMRADGDREALRLLMIDRDNAVQSTKTARTALAAVLVTAPAQLRERLRPLPRERRAKECAALACPAGADRQTQILHQTLIRLGQRIAGLAEEAAGLETQIAGIVEEMAPGLAAPTATVSTASATASSTAPSTSSPSPGCAATRPPSPTSSAAAPKAKPTRKSAAASSATSPATYTGLSARLDKHRSVISRQHVHWSPSPQVTVPHRALQSAQVRVSCGTSVLYSPADPLASTNVADSRRASGDRLQRGRYSCWHYGVCAPDWRHTVGHPCVLRVSSSQSNMRCSRRERAIGSQCMSAPSALVNGTSTLAAGRAA
jgi:Transposase